jgi:hypothetical protein
MLKPTAGSQDQRRTLKFGFSKMAPSKVPYITTSVFNLYDAFFGVKGIMIAFR